MPNTTAYLALATWPIVVILLFRVLPRPVALIWSVIGGYLFLPFGVGIDLPVVPPIDKTLVPAVAATILCLFFVEPHRPSAPPFAGRMSRDPTLIQVPDATSSIRTSMGHEVGRMARPRSMVLWVERILISILLGSPFLTVLLNQEPVFAETKWLPALTFYDGLSMMQGALVTILPYLLGRRFLGQGGPQVTLLASLCLAGLLYSLPTLFEVRMSPQLSAWTYGFLAQSFDQAVREGGFRPVVFLQHGLWLAIFLSMTLISAVALWRSDRKFKWLAAWLWLLGTLALCNSLGALAVGLVLLPTLLLPARHQVKIAALIAITLVSYPALRSAGLVPVDELVALAGSVSDERAQSLAFRFQNEDALLDRANENAWAGWGGWGRSQIFDPQTGEDTSVTDGSWILVIGQSGWLGYVGTFGLLALPGACLALRRRSTDISLATAGLSIVLSANLLDLIPNATMTPVTWLVAGALMGNVVSAQPRNPVDPVSRGRPGYQLSYAAQSRDRERSIPR